MIYINAQEVVTLFTERCAGGRVGAARNIAEPNARV
jgi:hypothetical protein